MIVFVVVKSFGHVKPDQFYLASAISPRPELLEVLLALTTETYRFGFLLTNALLRYNHASSNRE